MDWDLKTKHSHMASIISIKVQFVYRTCSTLCRTDLHWLPYTPSSHRTMKDPSLITRGVHGSLDPHKTIIGNIFELWTCVDIKRGWFILPSNIIISLYFIYEIIDQDLQFISYFIFTHNYKIKFYKLINLYK